MQSYADRLAHERERFDNEICVHDLPEIFHYWSNKYLQPMLHSQGYDNIEDFFARETLRTAAGGRTLQVVSVGCGDCATEVAVARRMVELGAGPFAFTCVDISGAALDRGREHVHQAGMGERFSFVEHDFNRGLPPGEVHVVIANQSLHHVVELEVLFDSIHDRLEPSGCLLTSDMIGRNGHQRWPEAREIVEEIWEWLPEGYRYNRQLQRAETQFMDWNCATEGFEGIRAQDVLPRLLERFDAGVFLAWGNIIDVFIDRGFGHGFHRMSEWDLHFIDRVHAIDEAAIAAGRIKPVHMLARFQREASACRHLAGLSPGQAVRTSWRPALAPVQETATHRPWWRRFRA